MGGGGQGARHSRRGSRRAGAAVKAAATAGNGGAVPAVAEGTPKAAAGISAGLLLAPEGTLTATAVGPRWSEMPVGEDEEAADLDCSAALQCFGLGPDPILATEGEKQAGKEEGASGAEPAVAQAGARKDGRPPQLPIEAVRRLPTPARGQASNISSSANSNGAISARSSGSKGPEPWGLPSAAAGPAGSCELPAPPQQQPQPWGAAEQSGGYRERLQARGQQAMRLSQRQQQQQPGCAGPLGTGGLTLAPSAPPPAYTPTAGVPPPPPTAAPSAPPAAPACPGGPPSPANAACPWAMLGAVQQLQQWFGTAGMQSGMQQVGMMPNGSQQASLMPGCNPQSLMLGGGCSPAALQLPAGSCGPSPMGSPTNASELSFPVTPAAAMSGGGRTPLMVGTPCAGACSPSQEELMATLMPDAFCLDRSQIEAQLRAAAPCIYDD